MDAVRMIGSLVLVFGLLGALLWGLKRLQLKVKPGPSGRRLQLLEAQSVGPRQKILLVRVDGQELLVGVSPGQICALGQWPAAPGQAAPSASFLDEVRHAM